MQYTKFGKAPAASGRDSVFGSCEWGRTEPWAWAPAVGTWWRTTGDIADRWSSVLTLVDRLSPYWHVHRPGDRASVAIERVAGVGKPLRDESRAVLLFNRTSVPTTMTATRDRAVLPSHGVVMLRVWPIVN